VAGRVVRQVSGVVGGFPALVETTHGSLKISLIVGRFNGFRLSIF
jgi:hypothetical protein